MLDRQQLETFATVLECQHFRKAAEVLHISAGAVTVAGKKPGNRSRPDAAIAPAGRDHNSRW
ncbi:LysR family transcriptional regulator [Caballeronia sp. LZ003]|uniref:LysR family transcriptional regulator n=1 Tax=unclassified Caballeronia TaxID=2646786 RepID=UPI0038579797